MRELLSLESAEGALICGDCEAEPHDLAGFNVKSLEVLSQTVNNSGISAHERLSTRTTAPKKKNFLNTVL